MIPRQAPRIAVDVETGAGSFGNHLDVPVCAGDLVLFSGAGDEGGVVFAAIDARTGAIRSRLTLAAEDGVLPEGGLPGRARDGSLIVPVYSKDRWLRLHRLAPDKGGDVEATFQLSDEDARAFNILAFDVGNKLFCGPTFATGSDDIAFAWLYRAVRFYRFEVRRSSDFALRWGTNEWLHGVSCDGGVMLGETTRDDGRELVARDATNGEQLWRRALARTNTEPLESVIGHTETAVVIVDRSGRVRARDEAVLAVLERSPDASSSELDAVESSVDAPSTIVARDCRSGALIWSREMNGELRSATVGTAAVGVATDREIALVDAGTGALIARSALPTNAKTAVVGATDEAVLLHDAGEDALVAVHVGKDGALVESWRMAVPSSGGARRALSDDRWLVDTPCRLGPTGIVLRAFDRLLIWR